MRITGQLELISFLQKHTAQQFFYVSLSPDVKYIDLMNWDTNGFYTIKKSL